MDVPHKSEDAIRQGDQIVRENLGKAGGRVVLQLRSAANHMKPYTVIRRYGEPPRVIDEQGNESRLQPGRDLLPGIEIYGQNEIPRVGEESWRAHARARSVSSRERGATGATGLGFAKTQGEQ